MDAPAVWRTGMVRPLPSAHIPPLTGNYTLDHQVDSAGHRQSRGGYAIARLCFLPPIQFCFFFSVDGRRYLHTTHVCSYPPIHSSLHHRGWGVKQRCWIVFFFFGHSVLEPPPFLSSRPEGVVVWRRICAELPDQSS